MDHGPWTKVNGPWTMDHGPWTMVPGLWTMDHGPWTMDHGPWAMDHGPWTMDQASVTKDQGPRAVTLRLDVVACFLSQGSPLAGAVETWREEREAHLTRTPPVFRPKEESADLSERRAGEIDALGLSTHPLYPLART